MNHPEYEYNYSVRCPYSVALASQITISGSKLKHTIVKFQYL